MPLKHDLQVVEDAVGEFVEKCAMYRRRNIFIFGNDSVAVINKKGQVQTFPRLTDAVTAIDKNSVDYPY